jgi:ATP-dependent DNA helicase RecG
LLLLNQLQIERSVDTALAADLIQQPESVARSVLARLVERGLVMAKGEKKGRSYHLGAALYAKMGQPEGYVHIRGFEPLQQEQMVLQYVDAHGKITRSQAASLCKLSPDQASRLLAKLSGNGVLKMQGRPPKGAYYVRVAQ